MSVFVCLDVIIFETESEDKSLFRTMKYERQIQDFLKGGCGLLQVWIFHIWNFKSGHIMQCVDKTPADKMLVDKLPVKLQGRTK